MRLYYTVVGSNPTTGTIMAAAVIDAQDNTVYPAGV
jgi:hypothetical protein